jgi:hypothetical protein
MTLRPSGEVLVARPPTTPEMPPDKRIHERRPLPPVPEAVPTAQNQKLRDRAKPEEGL